MISSSNHGLNLVCDTWLVLGYCRVFGLLWVFGVLFEVFCLFLNSVQDMNFNAYDLYKSTQVYMHIE